MVLLPLGEAFFHSLVGFLAGPHHGHCPTTNTLFKLCTGEEEGEGDGGGVEEEKKQEGTVRRKETRKREEKQKRRKGKRRKEGREGGKGRHGYRSNAIIS